MELIELDRIDGQGVLGFPVKQIVLEVMETDCIITEPFRFFDKILSSLVIEVVGSTDQIRAEKTDPLFRSVFKYQMPFPVRDNTSVFPGGHVAETGEIKRRIRRSFPVEPDRQPARSRFNHKRLPLDRETRPSVGQCGSGNHPDAFCAGEFQHSRRPLQRETGKIQADRRRRNFPLPCDERIGEIHRLIPVPAIPSGDHRQFFAGAVGITDFKRSDRLRKHRSPGRGVQQIQMGTFGRFRSDWKLCRLSLPEHQTRFVTRFDLDPDIIEIMHSVPQRAQIHFRGP